jgi:hypothetical protein
VGGGSGLVEELAEVEEVFLGGGAFGEFGAFPFGGEGGGGEGGDVLLPGGAGVVWRVGAVGARGDGAER